MGLLNKILKAGKKYGGPIAGQAVADYASKKAGKSSPALGMLVEAVVAPMIVEKLSGQGSKTFESTAYDPGRVVYKQPETAFEVQPMADIKSGVQTSTFKLAMWAMVIAPLIPIMQSLWENYVAKLPANSAAAIFAPVVTAIFYGITRYLGTANQRNNETQQVEAKAAVEVAKNIPVAPEPTRPPELLTPVVLNDDAAPGGTE